MILNKNTKLFLILIQLSEMHGTGRVNYELAYLIPTLYIAYLTVNSLFSTKTMFSTVFDASNFARDSNSTAARAETITLINIYICI